MRVLEEAQPAELKYLFFGSMTLKFPEQTETILVDFSDRSSIPAWTRMPNFAAAPLGPNIRPRLSFRAASSCPFLHEEPLGSSTAVSGLLSAEAAEVTSFRRLRISASQVSSTAR